MHSQTMPVQHPYMEIPNGHPGQMPYHHGHPMEMPEHPHFAYHQAPPGYGPPGHPFYGMHPHHPPAHIAMQGYPPFMGQPGAPNPY